MNAKKIIYLTLLICFLPIAIYTLGTGQFIPFFITALFVWIIMQVCEKWLKEKEKIILFILILLHQDF